MTWLTNIGNWFIENKDSIIVFLSGIDFTALSGLLILFFKQRKTINDNTNATRLLDESIKQNEQLNKDVTELKKENAELKKEIDDMLHNEELLLTKLNAMLDVQSLVYATIKDEPTRVAVSNILANAKYSETSTRLKLKEQLETLKKQITMQSENITKTVEETVNTTESIVDNTTESVVKRG